MFSILFTSQAFCPEWKCKALNDTFCATLHGYQVYANTKGCPIDYFCRLSEFQSWSLLESPSSTNSFKCTRQNYDGYSYSTLKSEPDFFCGFRDTSEELASGSHPKLCQSDTDCITKAGFASNCVCGFDGLSYCSAELGSSAFNGFWERCLALSGSSRNPRVTAIEKTYWMYYYNFYVGIISAPECLKDLLWEFSILNDLEMYTQGNCGKRLTALFFSFVGIILI